MSVPSYFNTNFRRIELVGVLDVQTIINSVRDELTLQLPVGSRWTEPVANQFRCPPQDVSGANRFFQISFVRTSATRLTITVTDKNGVTVTTVCLDIAVAGSTVKIWSGDYHLAIETSNLVAAGNQDSFYALMTDPTPFGYSMSNIFVVANAKRSSAGAALQSTVEYCFVPDGFTNPATTQQERILVFRNGAGSTQDVATTGGSLLAMPVYLIARFPGSIDAFMGGFYQCLIVNEDLIVGAEVEVQLDSGVVGVFEVLSYTVQSQARSGKLAIRKA